MTDETRDQAKKEGRICPTCGKEMEADHKGGTSAEGVCPRCGAVREHAGGAGSCACSTGGRGGG